MTKNEIIAECLKAYNYYGSFKDKGNNNNKQLRKYAFILNNIDLINDGQDIGVNRHTAKIVNGKEIGLNVGDIGEIFVKSLLNKKQVISKANEKDIKTNSKNNEIKCWFKDSPEIDIKQLSGDYIYCLTYKGLFKVSTKCFKANTRPKVDIVYENGILMENETNKLNLAKRLVK